MQRPNLRTLRDSTVSNRTARRCRAIAAAAGMLLAAHAGAAEISWVGPAGNPRDFGTGSNWAGGAVPGPADNGYINNGGIATVSGAFNGTLTNLRLGSDPATIGGITQSGGVLNATGNAVFGGATTGAGTLLMTAGTLNVGGGLLGDLTFGGDGAGTATISGTAAINTRFLFLGQNTNGHGHVTQSGGSITVQRNFIMAELKPAAVGAVQNPSAYTMTGGAMNVGSEMYIGAHGPSTFNLGNAGSVTVAGTVHIGASGALNDPPMGIGTLNMNGGTINVTGANAHFVIGDGGEGTFNFSGGSVTTKFYNTGQNFGAVGTVNHSGGAATAEFAWVVGEVSRGNNLYDLSGGTVTVVGVPATIPGTVTVGSSDGGKGTLRIRGSGAANVAAGAILGGGAFSGGTLEVSGGTLALGNSGTGEGNLVVGDLGTGTLAISGGHVSGDFLTFGQNAGALGTGTQTGGRFVVRGNVSVGEASTGANAFDVTGGTLSVGGGIYVGTNGTGTFRVGGTAVVTSAGTMESSAMGTGTVSVTGGSLTAPAFVNRGRYAQSGGTASLGTVLGTGQSSVSGGSLTASSIAQGTFQVSGGRVTVSPNGTSAATSVVNSLDVSATGKLDLTNNALVVPYSGTSPLPDIRADIVSGYAGGAWNGNGIISSQANANQFGIGYGEASGLSPIPAIFGTVTGDAVLVRHTRYGDANLDGTVNLQDFNRLAANFGAAANALWTQGDFTYDGTVNLQDFNRLAANFGLTASGPEVTPQDWAALATAIPEPAIGMGLVAMTLVTARRRRCSAG